MSTSPKVPKPVPKDAAMPWLAGTLMVTAGRTAGVPSSRWNVEVPTSLSCERITASSYWVVPAVVSGSAGPAGVTFAVDQLVACHIGEFTIAVVTSLPLNVSPVENVKLSGMISVGTVVVPV